MNEHNDFPFSYPGEKIKNLAKVLFYVFSVLSIVGSIVIAGIMTGATHKPIWLLLILAGPILTFVFWQSCLLLFGFGQLIENTNKDSNEKPDSEQLPERF